jgi:hypothetical protein
MPSKIARPVAGFSVDEGIRRSGTAGVGCSRRKWQPGLCQNQYDGDGQQEAEQDQGDAVGGDQHGESNRRQDQPPGPTFDEQPEGTAQAEAEEHRPQLVHDKAHLEHAVEADTAERAREGQGKDAGDTCGPAAEAERTGEEGHREGQGGEGRHHDHLEGGEGGQLPEGQEPGKAYRPAEHRTDEEELLVAECECRLPSVDATVAGEMLEAVVGPYEMGERVHSRREPAGPHGHGEPEGDADADRWSDPVGATCPSHRERAEGGEGERRPTVDDLTVELHVPPPKRQIA